MNIWYDRQGNPITVEQWTELHAEYDYIVVEKTPLMYHDKPVEVSTVWLGIDYNYGNRRPIIFETMVFGGSMDGEQWRYSTEKEAREHHAQIVHELTNRMSREHET